MSHMVMPGTPSALGFATSPGSVPFMPVMSLGPAVPAALVPSRGPPLQAPPETPAPASLTNGLADPVTIGRQKDEYVSSLDQQLKAGAQALEMQVKQQREGVREQAEKQKHVFAVQVDQQMRMQEMQVDHQYSTQVKELKKQAMRQRALLEQQALHLSFEYQDKKAEEDMAQHHFQLQQETAVVQEKLRSLPNVLNPLPSHPTLQAVHDTGTTVLPPTQQQQQQQQQAMMPPTSPLGSVAMMQVSPPSHTPAQLGAFTPVGPPPSYTPGRVLPSGPPSYTPGIIHPAVQQRQAYAAPIPTSYSRTPSYVPVPVPRILPPNAIVPAVVQARPPTMLSMQSLAYSQGGASTPMVGGGASTPMGGGAPRTPTAANDKQWTCSGAVY